MSRNSGAKPAQILYIGREDAGYEKVWQSIEQEGVGESARLIFITHEAREADVQATLDDLGELDVIHRITSVLRVVGDGQEK